VLFSLYFWLLSPRDAPTKPLFDTNLQKRQQSHLRQDTHPGTDIPSTPVTIINMKIMLSSRRHLLGGLAALAGAAAPLARSASPAPAGDDMPHKIVYQVNQADEHYQEAILNSVGALLGKYPDEISIVVVAWGPGIHLLAKQPKRPVPKLLQDRVKSMATSYGVRFIACGNTMQTIGWEASDMLDVVQVKDVGAAAVMELQQKGYAYLAW